MITKVFTATTMGLNVQKIQVEIDFSPALPSMIIVGLPDKAVQESKERIRAAIKQSGFEFPLGKVTVNLAPADFYKSGSGFDLPIAIGILKLTGFIQQEIEPFSLFVGELALDGLLRPVAGILSICLWARNNGFTKIYIPNENIQEASLVKGIEIFGISSLEQIVSHLNGESLLHPIPPIDLLSLNKDVWVDEEGYQINDLAYVKGQSLAKRALEIAASGGHNLMFIGQPGSGKTLLAKAYSTILPRLTESEILELTQIYSISGQLPSSGIMTHRPFRSPHHSASHIALVGGGSKLRPGEISLAHRGVLFLDEFPEFSRESIEALRQPLEDGVVTISRANGSVAYPCRFYLLAAANPTPSGYDPGDPDALNRPQSRAAIARYQAKFSGPILDRIDLQVEVNRPDKAELQSKELAEPSKNVAIRVQQARDIQSHRFKGTTIQTNSEMNLQMVRTHCKLDPNGEKILSKAIDTYKLSARSYMRLLKLSRTIADLAGHVDITVDDLAESLQYRGRWA